MFESDELQEDGSSIDTLTFSHPLITEEKEKTVYQMLSATNLKQVYFTDDVDLSTVEFIKCLIEFSSNIDDGTVEKIILKNDQSTIKKLSTLNYKYPNTWYVSFKNTMTSYELVSIPRFRNMENYFDSLLNELKSSNYSELEKIMRVYDIVKLFKCKDEATGNFYMPDAIESCCMDSIGFNILFSIILSKINIKSYVGNSKINNVRRPITLVHVVDDKYKLNGMYLFNPVGDNIPDGTGVGRRRFYNYFGLRLSDIDFFKNKTGLLGILGALSIQNYAFSSDKRESILLNTNNKSEETMMDTFLLDYKTMHQRCHGIRPIRMNDIVECLNFIYDDLTEEDFSQLISDYKERREQLFNNDNTMEDELK